MSLDVGTLNHLKTLVVSLHIADWSIDASIHINLHGERKNLAFYIYIHSNKIVSMQILMDAIRNLLGLNLSLYLLVPPNYAQ